MKVALAIWRNDLRVLWSTPIPYVVGALFQALLGVLFVDQLQGRSQALTQPLYPLLGFLLLVTVPIISMRSIAEEARSGTLDLLLAVPTSTASIVAGKWLATATTVLLVVLPASAHAAMVALFGEPERGPMVAGLLGVTLLIAALSAIGVLASAATSSSPVAAMVAFVVSAVLWFAGAARSTVSAGGVLDHLSLSERLRTFAAGAVDTADVGFLVALVVLGLGAATAVLDLRRSR